MDMVALTDFVQKQEPQSAGQTTWSDPADWLIDSVGGPQSSSGIRVNAWTAMTSGAVWQCLKIISNDISGMPIEIVDNNKQRDRQNRQHPAYKLMNLDSHYEIAARKFRQTMQHWVLLHGNAIAAIRRDSLGRPVSLTPLRPGSTYIERDPDTGALWYIYRTEDGMPVPFSQWEVLHIKGLGDGIWGYSVLELMRDDIGSGLAAAQYRASQWANNTRPDVIITKTGRWDEEGKRGFVRQWRKQHEGWNNAGRIACLTGEYNFETVSGISNEQAQLVEQIDKDVSAVARFFNIPAYKLGVGINSNRANLEQQQLEYLQSTLQEWIDCWEDEVRRKLLSERDQVRQHYSVRTNTKSLIKTDTAGRFEQYSVAFQNAFMSPNDIREAEDMDIIEGGNFYISPLNMQQFGPDAQEIEPEPAPAPEPEPEEDTEDTEDTEDETQASGIQDYILKRIESIQVAEANKIKAAAKAPQHKRNDVLIDGMKDIQNRLSYALLPLSEESGWGDREAIEAGVRSYIVGAVSQLDAGKERNQTAERLQLVESIQCSK